jgi:hypothetical protein
MGLLSHQCLQKRRYATKGEAQSEIDRWVTTGRLRYAVSIYHCAGCLGYHIGRARRKTWQ